MKKLLFAAAFAFTASLFACNSGADKNADSEKTKNDSLAAVHHTDSLMMAQKQQHTNDSIKAAQTKTADTTKAPDKK